MTPEPWDQRGPLPRGVTVLEASAGTGKTHAIAGLAARYVADGVPLDRLLVVTFTRMATGELRERVRDRLTLTERHLRGAVTGTPPPPDDQVTAAILDGPADQIGPRRLRLAGALADFDAATITTTHAFCQRMLATLGVGAGDDEGVVADADDLLSEVVDDRYLRRALVEVSPPFGRATALAVARAAVDNPTAALAAVAGPATSAEGLRLRLAHTVRKELAARKLARGVVTYDDLLTRLDAALSDPAAGAAAVAALRHRFEVVLVDEFQDTDDLQWSILSRAFAAPGPEDRRPRALVLIGDPKQAIYAFRGADVQAYLDAAHCAERIGTLEVNWRSDGPLLAALDALFAGAALGHPEIVHRSVRATPGHRDPGLAGPAPAPLRVRILHRDDGVVRLTPKGFAAKPATRRVVATDLAGDVVALLSGGTEVIGRDVDGAETGRRPLRPSDVAVLTRINRSAALWHQALLDAGVPAVLNGAGSVFATRAGTEWLQLLEALERPSNPQRVHALALTSWIGWDAAAVDAAGEAAWEELHATCHRWSAVLRRSGVAALAEVVTASTDVPGRTLAMEDGERHITDLRHVGELLHAEASAEHLGTAALATWLRDRIAGAGRETDAEERARRLESDADAVTVLTIHRSKGLEWPVVYLPDLWEAPWVPDDDGPVAYHDRDAGNRRTIDVSGGGPAFARHRLWHHEEVGGEDLRLAYVALTRARHQVVLWWAGTVDAQRASLGRLLLRGTEATPPLKLARPPTDGDVAAAFADLGRDGTVSVERVAPAIPARLTLTPAADRDLAAAGWDRDLDIAWRRTSYTSLTADAHDPAVGSEPEDRALDDETATPAPEQVGAAGADDPLRSIPLPLGGFAGGARFGSMIHTALEGVEFAGPGLRGRLTDAVTTSSSRWQVELDDVDGLAAGIQAALETPLGPLADGLALVAVPAADRLDELAFELPVAGGDRPGGAVSLVDVADLLQAHLEPGDPLAGYPARLRDPNLGGDFRGFLTGSLDLVVRLRRPGGDRWLVADYKTNTLGTDPATRSLWDYRPDALAVAMIDAHYPLQAMLYCVALHRYLRWRVAGYDPARQLGGVLYLFLRGMTGPEAPRPGGRPCGVFSWHPPAPLVTDLSDLLDRGRP